MSNRMDWATLLLGVAASLAFFIGISGQWLLIGSAEGAWAYRYVQHFSVHSVVVALLAAGAAAFALRLPMPASKKGEGSLVLFWLALALLGQVLIRSLTPFSFESIFISDGANSFYTVTERHDPLTVLREFGRIQRGSAVHAQSNMPGKLMLLYALRVLSDRPDVLPWLVVMVSNFGGVLMYLFVRDLFRDRTIALYSMVLYFFVPAKLVFFPLLNTVTPVLVLACLWVLMLWLRTRRVASAVLLGVALYALVFFEPLPLVMGVLFAALALRAVVDGQLTWQQLVLQISAMVVAFVFTAEAVLWLGGFNLVETFARIRGHALAFNAAEGRPYWVWIRANLWEFVAGVGICQALLFLAALRQGLSRTGSAHQSLMQPIAVLCLSLLAVLITVDLIGINRGEVVRLWIFLACMFQIPAAYVCAQMSNFAAIAFVAATSIVHAAVGTSMIGFVVP